MASSDAGPGPDYVVVIGDIVGSRELPDRASVQDRYREAIEAFNERAMSRLAAPLELTGGDEAKTILEDPSAALDVVTELSDAMYPVTLAWGIGRGPIHTSWVPEVGRLDGPCFHRARRAIDEASREGIWASAAGFSSLDDQVLTALFRLIGALRASWTESQVRSIRAVRDRSQKEAAREIGLTESGISKSLRRAQFHDVRAGEAAVGELLASYRDREPGAARPATDQGGE